LVSPNKSSCLTLDSPNRRQFKNWSRPTSELLDPNECVGKQPQRVQNKSTPGDTGYSGGQLVGHWSSYRIGQRRANTEATCGRCDSPMLNSRVSSRILWVNSFLKEKRKYNQVVLRILRYSVLTRIGKHQLVAWVLTPKQWSAGQQHFRPRRADRTPGQCRGFLLGGLGSLSPGVALGDGLQQLLGVGFGRARHGRRSPLPQTSRDGRKRYRRFPDLTGIPFGMQTAKEIPSWERILSEKGPSGYRPVERDRQLRHCYNRPPDLRDLL
jgi:hypothetical protein